jgi:steroid delta-isomerase-like uncharacterized protein
MTAAASATAPPTDVSNADLIRWSFETINRQDLPALKQIWADDIVERFPDETCTGIAEVAAHFENLFSAISEWRVEVIGLVEQGEDVFVRWRLTGVHTGVLLGVAPTGKPLTVDGMDHFVMRDGKVASNFVIYDQMEFARQVGMMPPDGSAVDKGLKAAFNGRTKLVEKLKQR